MEKKFSRLFAFDLDGTLVHDGLNGVRTVPSSLLACVGELAKTAHVIVATGRRVRSALPVLGGLPAMQFGVFHNGLIVRKSAGDIVVRRKILKEEVSLVSETLKDLGQPPILVLDGSKNDIDFAFEKGMIFRDASTTYAWERAKDQSALVNHFDDLVGDYEDQLLEVACIGNYERLLEIQSALKDRLPSRLRAIVVRNCGYEGRSVLEVFDAEASKWSGIEYVKKSLQVEEVIAVGDDENDMEMLEWADVGVVMKHALPHIKEKAQIEVDGATGLEEYLRGSWLR